MQLTVKDAARLLNISEKTVYRWIKQEIIPVYRINEQLRFNRAELLEWATSRRIQVSPEIFRALIDVIKLPEEVDREFLFQVLLARESLGSTGIGDGIAIPHVRNPIVMHIPRPMVTLCFLREPVAFDAIDHKPVHTLFAIVSPPIRAHLHLLSRLSFALKHPSFLDALAAKAGPDALLRICRTAEDPSAGLSEGEAAI